MSDDLYNAAVSVLGKPPQTYAPIDAGCTVGDLLVEIDRQVAELHNLRARILAACESAQLAVKVTK